MLLLMLIASGLAHPIAQPCSLLNSVGHDRGFALVIGNSSYPKAPLRTTLSDACEVGKTLDNLGYSVDLRFDLNGADLNDAVQQIARAAAGKNLPLIFYFAGHGFQINGVNYLLPVDFDARTGDEIPRRSVSLDSVFSALKLAGNAPKIVILDACRANPLAQISPNDWIPGLAAPTNAPANTLIAFSTDPGSVAADGAGSHSPYTRALLNFSVQPGLGVEDVFKAVRDSVETNTDGEQTPWENTSLLKPFCFRDSIYAVARISDADDDAIVEVNGREIAEWNVDGHTPRNAVLHLGPNDVAIKVYNQRSYTGGIPPFGHLPEGWRCTVDILDSSGRTLVQLNEGEDRPADNGPRHGKLFTVSRFQLIVDELTGAVTIANGEFEFWKDH